jgi:predicted RNA-binding protein YlxR (DUF448 family)
MRVGQRHNTTVKTSARPRRVPQRTCIACRRVEGKRQLVRIVRTPAGTVELDPTGRQNGRGAYLHADPACWDAAFKRKVIQHALKTELTDADRLALEAYRASLAPQLEPAQPPREEGDEQR